MASLFMKVALVTGASQGIGRACALELARRGTRVVAGARQEEKLALLVEEIRVSAMAGDVASPGDARRRRIHGDGLVGARRAKQLAPDAGGLSGTSA